MNRTSILPILAIAVIIALHGLNSRAGTVVYDLKTDWSDGSNPNGRWTFRENTNALPHLDWWQRTLGGWCTAQPGWADSEDGNDRAPFWFRSVGSETFSNDLQPGDICAHTIDNNAGVGNGSTNVIWTSPLDGTIDITGGVWMGVGLGRGNNWSLSLNGVLLTGGSIYYGDAYDRAGPFSFAAGSGGASACDDVAVAVGDILMLELVRTSTYGSLVGVNLTVTGTVAGTVTPIVHAGADLTVVVGSTLTAGGWFEDPDPDPWTATVDYGEGMGPETLTLNADKTFTLSHVYSALGTYTVTVTLSDNAGAKGSDTVAVVVRHAPTFLGPSAYLGFDSTHTGAGANISPFAGITFIYFYLETFEDGLLNTLGVTNTGGVVGAPGIYTDSVDGDDGVIDGDGHLGRSIANLPPANMTFTFDAGVLGCLPTHVGLVWTDYGK